MAEEYFEDEFEDEEYEDDYDDYDEAYEEDLDVVGAEPIVKTAIGMDAFAVIFSFFAVLAAGFLLSYFVLYQVYDCRVGGIMPAKEIPANQEFKVLGFGCDEELSNVYNYAIVNGGTSHGLEPGMVLYIGDKSVAMDKSMTGSKLAKANDAYASTGRWGICMVVTEEIEESICKAEIVKILPPKKVGIQSAIKNVAGGTDSTIGNWESLSSMTALTKNLNWLTDPTCKIADWKSEYQWIVKYVEDEFSSMKRVKKQK